MFYIIISRYAYKNVHSETAHSVCLFANSIFSISFLSRFDENLIFIFSLLFFHNQCPSSLNNLISLPRNRQMYRIPTPPAFKDDARRTSSTRSISKTRPSSQTMALGWILPSRSKSALTCKLIFIITASLYCELLFAFYCNTKVDKRKANKMKNPAQVFLCRNNS